MRTDILTYESDIRKWISEMIPKAEICRRLHCKPSTLNSYLVKMGIEYKGNPHRESMKHKEAYRPASAYFDNKKRIQSCRLKEKLIYDGIKEPKCERCGLKEWLNEPIPLELHHINGNHYDNSLSNLQILCPNCHSLTYNNSGKAVRTKLKKDTQEKNTTNNKKKLSTEEYVKAKQKAGETTYRRKRCRKVTRPESYEIFKKEMNELGWNYCAMGRKYGVSDNAIRKWEKGYQKHDGVA